MKTRQLTNSHSNAPGFLAAGDVPLAMTEVTAEAWPWPFASTMFLTCSQ